MVRSRLLPNFFFLPFQISYRIVKAFIFNKNEGNNQKVENKVSGRVLHYVKIAGCSAMYTVIVLYRSNSGNYLHFSIVVHYKTVCNNKVLSVNYNFNSNY